MTSHVFIVGLPRTGSTLTRGLLNASADVWVAGESHYFSEPTRLGLVRRPGYAERFAAIGDLRTESGLERVVTHIFSMTGKSFWARLAARTNAEQFSALLRETERTPRDLLDTAMAVFAQDRRIRGEKTPHHIFHVPTLLKWFPDARIIHTFRDPRAIYASLRRKERGDKLTRTGRAARQLGRWFDLYATLNLARTWRSMARLHRQYERQYADRYTLIRFEDLVQRPAPTAELLAAHVGVAYTTSMLEQVVHNSSYMEKAATAGIDPSVVHRWRDHLSARTAHRITRLCLSELEAFGYRA